MPSSEVMSKYAAGRLRSGSKHGPAVHSRAQAIAIMMSERRKEADNGGVYPESEHEKKRAAKRRIIAEGGK